MSVRDHHQLHYPLGLAALVVGIFVLQGVLNVFIDGAVESGFPVWMPTFGTVGRTVMVYLYGQTLYAHVLVPAAAFWLGMRYARDA